MKEAWLLQRFVCVNNELRRSVAHLLDGLRVWKIFSPFRTAMLHLFHSIALFCTLSSAHNDRGHLDSFYLPDGMFHNQILIFLYSVHLRCPWRSAQVWMLWNRKMCFNCVTVGNWLFKPLLIIVQKLRWVQCSVKPFVNNFSVEPECNCLFERFIWTSTSKEHKVFFMLYWTFLIKCVCH